MAGDPLYEPLGTDPTRDPASGSRRAVWIMVTAMVLLAGAAGAAFMTVRAPSADQTGAIAAIEIAPNAAASPPSGPVAPTAPPPATVQATTASSSPPGTTVEVQNGVKIIRFNPAASSASILVPADGSGVASLRAAPDASVSETSPDGVLPRIGSDGSRPADVYARHVPLVTGPRVAILLAGMGSDQVATADAARRLSADFTFAFAPEVADAAAQVAEARRAGHEIVLDLATVPANPAAVSAGSDELRTLHRSMTRFAGYVGALIDPASGNAAASRAEFASRGLLTLEPAGGSPSSATPVDVDVDAGRGGAAIAAALDRLADLARTRGQALAVIRHAASAQGALTTLPDALVGKGITLVPATALGTPKSEGSSAQH